MFSNLSSFDQLRLMCPAGTEVDVSTPDQFICTRCGSDYLLSFDTLQFVVLCCTIFYYVGLDCARLDYGAIALCCRWYVQPRWWAVARCTPSISVSAVP